MSQARTGTGASIGALTDSRTLLNAVDSVPSLHGFGMVLIEDGRVERLRLAPTSGETVVIERRSPVWPPAVATSPPALPVVSRERPRDVGTSVTTEWMSAGFNCGGMVLAWVGVVGTGAVAPVTGGASLVGTALLWGGAIATTGQCAASAYRLTNIQRGRTDINETLDADPRYVWTMRGADVIGLVSGAGALREVAHAAVAADKVGIGLFDASRSSFSRPMRLRMTQAWELQGAKRVSAVAINAVAKQRLLDALCAAVGITGSAATGATKDLVVWVVTPTEAAR